MNEPINILVMEDRQADFLLIERHLKQNALPAHCSRVDRLEQVTEAISTGSWNLVLADYNMPNLNFRDSLNLIMEALPNVPIILVSGSIGEERAVELLKHGVWDFVLKENLSRLATVIERNMKDARERLARRAAEAALVESEKRLSSALTAARMGVWEWNVLTNDIFWSPECRDILGQENPAGTLDSFRKAIYPDDAKRVITKVQMALTGKTIFMDEHRIIRPDGAVIWLSNVGRGEYDQSGTPLRMLGTVQDITERHSLEEQFRQAQKMEAVGQLAGGVAHDFNNILTAILGYGSLIEKHTSEDNEIHRYLNKLLAAADQAASLTKSLLAYSRKQPLDRQPVDVCSIVRKSEHLLSRLLSEDIEIVLALDDKPLIILADAHQVEQVLMNLATNARDAMPRGGALRISVGEFDLTAEFIASHGYGVPGKYALIEATDSGIGMDETTMKRIFEPFFTTKDVGRGTGLGLSTTYGIIKQHNGFIDVSSELGKGTTFACYLPLTDIRDRASVSKDCHAPVSGNETVLLVDDDAQIRGALKELLEDCGYTVIEAVDGEDGILKFREHENSVQLVILDMIMPKKSGKETYEEIAAIRPGTKVIFLSGYPLDSLNEKEMLHPGENFIAKPFAIGNLLKKIRETLTS